MQFTIYFCVDGILRANPIGSKDTLIPLTFIQQNKNQSDLSFWGRWWHYTVLFEKGLTISQFMQCLAPWAKFFGELTQTDISAYLTEVNNPPRMAMQSDNNTEHINWINLSVMVNLKPEISYAPDSDLSAHSFNINEWLNSKKQTKLTGLWYIDSVYQLTGYVNGKEEQYAVDYLPMNELANIPLVLDENQYVVVDDYYVKAILSADKQLFNESAFSVCKLRDNLTYLVSKKTHSLREVVEGFFENLMTSPIARDVFTDKVKDSLKEIDSVKAESTKSNDKLESETEKSLSVTVTPGAFDSVIEDHHKFSDYWKKLKTLAFKDRHAVVRLHTPLSAKSDEIRLYGYILDENSILAMGSEYKLL